MRTPLLGGAGGSSGSTANVVESHFDAEGYEVGGPDGCEFEPIGALAASRCSLAASVMSLRSIGPRQVRDMRSFEGPGDAAQLATFAKWQRWSNALKRSSVLNGSHFGSTGRKMRLTSRTSNARCSQSNTAPRSPSPAYTSANA